MDIIEIVHAAVANPDQAVRAAAEEQLKGMESENPAMYFVALAQGLANTAISPEKRQAVGLAMKSALDKDDKVRKYELHKRWLELDGEAKETVKQALVQTFADDVDQARTAAAQVAAKVAAIDLPQGQWDSFVTNLCSTITDGGNPYAKQSSLKCLGFMCEDLKSSDAGVLEEKSNEILAAVVSGMNDSEVEIKVAGTKALNDALDFCTENMQEKEARDLIMEAILNQTVIEHPVLREQAYMCLAKVAGNHYDEMGAYLEAIFPNTAQAIAACGVEGGIDEEEKIGWQAIEFWTELCEEEANRVEDEDDEEWPSKNYMTEIAPHLVPLLLEALTKQDEDQSPDDFNLCSRAAVCLRECTLAVRDGMPPHVAPFVMERITSDDWHDREAAIMSYGCLLEGPSSEVLGDLLPQGIGQMVEKLQDESEHVRDTSAWSLGKIAEHHPLVFKDNMELLQSYFVPLCQSLTDVPRVAFQACYALGQLGVAWQDDEDCEETYPLSGEAYTHILTQLLATTQRADSDECELRTTAYEAIAQIIDASPLDCAESNGQLLPEINSRLEATFVMGLDPHKAQTLQGVLCGIMNNIIMKLDDQVLPYADAVMTLLIKVFESKYASVVEEAIRCAGSLADGVKEHFINYCEAFIPHLLDGLHNWAETDVCRASVGATGDVCRALGPAMTPFCERIVTLLMEALQAPDLARDVKPDIFGVLGDIALAIGDNFVPFADFTMNMLMQASTAPLEEDAEEDEIECVLQLREAVAEGVTGLIQGLKETEAGSAALKPILMKPQTSGQIMQFLSTVTMDVNSPDGLLKTACGVLGDLCVCLEGDITPILGYPWVEQLCDKCSNSEDENMAENGKYTTGVIRELLSR